jgi:pimeloyl-ACP methyl ester carboxylesterase
MDTNLLAPNPPSKASTWDLWMRVGLALLIVCPVSHAEKPSPSPTPPLPANVEVFLVRTRSEQNREVPFYLRKPAGYDPTVRGVAHRILFICPVFNGDGSIVVRGERGYQPLINLADRRGWFVLCPTFKQAGGEVRNRRKSYYYPEEFSGKAVLDALDLIAKKYPVDTERLLMQGLSGGAQFVHRFALWAPERVTAVAVNSSSWFDPPNPKAALCAWLVTIGDSDASYSNSVEFVAGLRDAGASPLFRSYLGMVHEGSPKVDALNAAFLTFYDEQTRHQLGNVRGIRERQDPPKALSGSEMPYLGDSQDWRYYPNTADNLDTVPPDVRIALPSEEIARLWGEPEAAQ